MSALDRELATLRGFASCRGDDVCIDEAEAELAALRNKGAEADHLADVALKMQGREKTMVAALGWYEEMAKAMRHATLAVDNLTALHVLKQLALDGGDRARAAIGTGVTHAHDGGGGTP